MKKYLLVAFFGALLSVAQAESPYDGSAISNVQDYSSSPFYTTGGGYNQGFPTPIYVKGPSLSSAECLYAVNSAIWTQCSLRNNCAGLSAGDIRLGVVSDLANRQDNNYATACSGYLDNAFAEFKKQTGNSGVSQSGFPSSESAPMQVQNPFTYFNQMPAYEREQKLRELQLRESQQQNNGQPDIAVAQMPGAFPDMGYEERMQLLRQGWQDPAVAAYPSYPESKLESDESAVERKRLALQYQEELERAKKTGLK